MLIQENKNYSWFSLKGNKGNNSFVFSKYPEKNIYVAPLITGTIEDIKIGNKIVFQEINSKWELIQCKWLKNFVKINKENSNIYIFDNHNHALYFRYKEQSKWFFSKWIKLIHIDQHTDMNENKNIIENTDLKNIFEFTNEKCNVWNFIKPAIEEWLVWNIELITTEYKLLNFDTSCHSECNKESNNYILDIDIDFRDPNMSIEKQDETIQKTRKLIKHAKLVTIATSPYFIDQEYAINIIKIILKNGD